MSRVINVKNSSIVLTFLLAVFAIQFGIIILRSQKSLYEYSKFLIIRFLGACGSIFALLIIFMLVGIVIFKKFDPYCIETWMIIVWATFIIIGLIWMQYQFQAFDKDIQNEDYVVYNGDFKKDSSREFIFLADDSSTRLCNTNETFLETGYYSGKIVYSKRTKYVLSYTLNTGETANVP